MKNIGFIRARLIKDNFWNLVFWVFVVGVVGLSEQLARIISVSLVLPITIPVFISGIYFAAKFNPVTLSDEIFTSKAFRLEFFVVFSSAIFVTALVAFPFFLLQGKILFKLGITNIVGWFLLLPTIYCILKNTPVSIFFNKKLLIQKVNSQAVVGNGNVTGYNHMNSRTSPTSSYNNESLLSTSNLVFNPMNSWYSSNSCHRKS